MAKEKQITVTPTKFYKSKGILLSAALAPLGFIESVREFIQHYAWLQPLLTAAWGIAVRYISKSPLIINKPK